MNVNMGGTMMKIKNIVFTGLLFTALLIISGCQGKILTKPYSAENFNTGTYVKVNIYDRGKKAELDKTFDLISKYEKELSPNLGSNSEFAQMARNAGVKPTKVTSDVLQLMNYMLQTAKLTNGAYNPAIGPAVAVWHIGYSDQKVPTEEQMKAIEPLLNCNDIEMNVANKTIFLKQKGMSIDTGGVGKGYIASKVLEQYKKEGLTTAYLNFGGHVFTYGKNPNREDGKWQVSVSDPRLQLDGTTLSSLGKITSDYHTYVATNYYGRFMEKDGKVYSHLLDSTTGMPVNSDILTCLVIGENPVTIDVLSNALYNYGVEKGLDFLNNRSDVEGLYITKDKKIYLSQHMKQLFVMSKEAKKQGFVIANE
jgi:thiamine biosynthesis lipoprotein